MTLRTLLLAGSLAFAATPALASETPAAPAPTPQAVPVSRAAVAPLPDADPALWVVRDADTIVYLFGTFHLLDGRTWFNDEVKTAFDRSEELIVEVLLPEDQAEQQAMILPIVMRYAVDPQGRALSSLLTPEQNAALYRIVADVGVRPGQLDRFEPWFVNLTLTQAAAQQLQLEPQNGPEPVLRRAAAERRMAEGELETIEDQIRVLDGVPEEDQLRALREALDDVDEMPVKLAPMLEAWSRGEVERLAALLNEDIAGDRAMYDALFTTRNANWARWIRERMARPGTVFVAVGAGHLAGRGSVQEQLRALGLVATRVPHLAAP